MAKQNGSTAPQIDRPHDTIRKSVTVDDVAKYTGHGVINLLLPAFSLGEYEIYGLPPELPPVQATAPWSKARDLILAATPKAEGKWGGVVNKFCSKIVARGRVVESPISRRIDNVNQMLDLCNGAEGFEDFLERMAVSFLTSSSIGAIAEIVRVSRSPGAKIVTLNALDPLRCWRTGDPDTPIIYWDLMGHYHELRSWECFMVTDMKTPRAGWWWGGQCASERAYRDIRKVAAMNQLFDEKITGAGYTSIVFIPGTATMEQIDEAMKESTENQLSKGVRYYQGKILIPFFGDKDSFSNLIEIPLKNLPEGWDREKELEFCEIQYALASGIPFSEINPRLSARGALGVGAQTQTIDDAQAGALPAKFVKMLTNKLNRLVTPQATTIALRDNDLRDDKLKAEIAKLRADARSVMRGTAQIPGELTGKQSLYLAVQSDDAPREFMNATTPVDETLRDTEKPLSEADQAALESANAADTAEESAPDEERPQEIQVKEIQNGYYVSVDGRPPTWVRTKQVGDVPGLRHSMDYRRCDVCKYVRHIQDKWYCLRHDFPTADDWYCLTWTAVDGSSPDEPPAHVKEHQQAILAQIEKARELYRKAQKETHD
jgi:hypothetical protein